MSSAGNETNDKHKPERASGKKTSGASSSGSSTKKNESDAVKLVMDETNNKLLAAISSLQGTIQKQNARMADQDKKISEQNSQMAEVINRLNSYDMELENNDFYGEGPYEYSQDFENPGDLTTKRKSCDDDETSSQPQSRFASMCKRFKANEKCDKDIDQSLADSVTDLFRNGIDEDRYHDLVKDDLNARPGNCEGLSVVQTNSLIWDAVSASARGVDKKMQNIEASVVKAATILTKVVDSMAKMEHDLIDNQSESDSPKPEFVEKFGLTIEDINSSLALLGHCNKQINLARKDFLRPQLNKDYSHLCNHNRPFTNLLFGDDVSKVAKEIEDCSKISNKMFHAKPLRGSFNRQDRGYRSFRPRGGFRGGRGVSNTERSSTVTSSMMSQTKNYRRGPRQNPRQ